MKKELEDHGQCSSPPIINNNIQSYKEHLLLQQQMQQNSDIFGGGGGSKGLMFPPEVVSSILQQQPWSIPPVPSFNPNPVHYNNTNPVHLHEQASSFLVPPPTTTPSPYASFFSSRRVVPSLHFAYEGPSSHHDHHHLRIISDTLGPMVQPGSAAPFGLQAELGKMTAQEIMEAKALAASKSHSEAERRRRERINNHLAKLRSLLPNTTKTDKASLLAEVIQQVKELKRQTSLIVEMSTVPTESDELTVDAIDEDGKFVIKASLCCEDRSDLLPDLIKTLKALRLRTLRAEITSLGGRVKNVLVITGDEEENSNTNNGEQSMQQQYCISSIQEALKAVMEKSGGGDESASGNVKRQRTTTTNNKINILEQSSL
ncbi:Transcription factor bHLH30 [Glycine soja]|uniref:Transcription factor bHLH30 n=1 Tax=Glycine soja TaxID=3848 RepID=A0A0B2PDY9_GLYSO|nr:Transcription factor bHLH30 [Glycine soja]